MDMSNRRFTQGASGDVGETMESGDWRTQLQRQRTVNKLMDTLKRYLPFSGYERLQELKKIAERVEEETYIASTSQSEYSRKTCFMILTMETRLQGTMSDPMQPSSAANSVYPSVPFHSTTQTGNLNGGNWQEEVYQKIKAMKELYLLELRHIQGDWRAQLQPDSRQRVVNKIMDTLKRHLSFSGHEGQHELKKIAVRIEEKAYIAATSQSDYLRKLSLKMLNMENKSLNPVTYPVQSTSAVNSVNPLVSSDYASQTSTSNGGNRQEEVYQKGARGDVGDPTLEFGDWRAQLQADSRQRIVNKILDTLKRHLPYSGDEGLLELKNIAERFEEKTYIAATSQSDYLRKISLKMLSMETGSQNPVSYPMQSQSAANSVDRSVPLDYTAQTSNTHGGDWH